MESINLVQCKNQNSGLAAMSQCLIRMIKNILEYALEAEMDEILGYSRYKCSDRFVQNSRNGHSTKSIESKYGQFKIKIPRDRKSSFKPYIVSKYKKSIVEIEDRLILMYAKGFNKIKEQILYLYGNECESIADKIMKYIYDWQNRKLKDVYPFIFINKMLYEFNGNRKLVYVLIGAGIDVPNDILSIWIEYENKEKFWKDVLDDLSQRGIKNMAIIYKS